METYRFSETREIKNKIVFTPTPITLFYWIPTAHTFYYGGQYIPKYVYWSHFVFHSVEIYTYQIRDDRIKRRPT